MPDSVATLWGVFLAGVLSVVIILGAFVTALIIGQRRRLAMERELGRRILRAQEDERGRVAREIHDDALQRLALLRLELERLGSRLDQAGRSDGSFRLRSLIVEAEELGLVLRGLAHRLHPAVVDQVGLCRALETLGDDSFRLGGLEVAVSVPAGDLALEPDTGLAAYRIAQEALRNVATHAATSTAAVSLKALPDGILLRVSDRGRGFDSSDGEAGRGLGLVTMRERAASVGGTLRVFSRRGEGTTIEAYLPGGKD